MRLRTIIVACVAALLALAVAGPALAQADPFEDIPEERCAERLLDLPALDACRTADGRVIMDLPALKLVEPKGLDKEVTPVPDDGPGRLPKTGANARDLAAIGLAALAGGGVLVRRLRLAAASS
jgi:LPXTG-motif cell wall-anchored protein